MATLNCTPDRYITFIDQCNPSKFNDKLKILLNTDSLQYWHHSNKQELTGVSAAPLGSLHPSYALWWIGATFPTRRLRFITDTYGNSWGSGTLLLGVKERESKNSKFSSPFLRESVFHQLLIAVNRCHFLCVFLQEIEISLSSIS